LHCTKYYTSQLLLERQAKKRTQQQYAGVVQACNRNCMNTHNAIWHLLHNCAAILWRVSAVGSKLCCMYNINETMSIKYASRPHMLWSDSLAVRMCGTSLHLPCHAQTERNMTVDE